MKHDLVYELIGGGTSSWPRLRELTRAMSYFELAEAEKLERLARSSHHGFGRAGL
jgi:hypothetical protein